MTALTTWLVANTSPPGGMHLSRLDAIFLALFVVGVFAATMAV